LEKTFMLPAQKTQPSRIALDLRLNDKQDINAIQISARQ